MTKSKNFGIKAIIKNYNKRLLFRGAWTPLIATFIIVTLFISFGTITKEILVSVVDIILAIIPNLLGFVLSGYALLIGFGNIEVIAKVKQANNSTDSKPSLYQKVSTVFAVGLIMQIVLLVTAFGFKLILKLELPCFFENFRFCVMMHYAIFFLLVFGFLYVTVMIKDLVVNIFNFSQVQHFFINGPKPVMNKDEDKK